MDLKIDKRGWPENTDRWSIDRPLRTWSLDYYAAWSTDGELEIWLTVCLFCFLLLLPPSLWRWKEDLRTSKKTDNLAKLRIRCRPPIAPAILLGSFLLVFIDSSPTSKIRLGISPCFHFFHGETRKHTHFPFPTKKDSKKKFKSRRIHPFFIFLKLFDSNYCDKVWRNAR